MHRNTLTFYPQANPFRDAPMTTLYLDTATHKTTQDHRLHDEPWQDGADDSAASIVKAVGHLDACRPADLETLRHVVVREVARHGRPSVLDACAKAMGPRPRYAVLGSATSYSWGRWAEEVPVPAETGTTVSAPAVLRRRLILHVIARAAKPDGTTTYVSMDVLARATRSWPNSVRANNRTLNDDLERLERAGLLTVEQREGKHCRFTLHARIPWAPNDTRAL